jgi:dynein assembly factor 2, axonemal
MAATSFEDKLKDLHLTNDELQRFSTAFKNEEFRKLFFQYAEELNDPKNRELYENEIRAVEEQQGSDVTFVHPKAGHVLKTTLNGKQKCFINIATNEHVEKPSFNKADTSSNKTGVHWSLPHCLAGPHEDLDHDSKPCTIYDVIFSPDTYRMAETNSKFMSMIEESALDSIEKNYHCQLDKNNTKRLKMKFKGAPKATIIRKKKDTSLTPNGNHVEDQPKCATYVENNDDSSSMIESF